jgi:hypothetical protein
MRIGAGGRFSCAATAAYASVCWPVKEPRSLGVVCALVMCVMSTLQCVTAGEGGEAVVIQQAQGVRSITVY